MKKIIKTNRKANLLLVAIIGIAILLSFGACGKSKDTNEGADNTALSGVVKTGGSTSVEKVMTALIYQFQSENQDVTIDYEMNGSGDGIKNTISNLYEIGHSSRDLTEEESADLEQTAYAIDGIAIVVAKSNNVPNLTNDQLRDIYDGKIKNWKEVGGKDALITVVTREEGSGTRDAFEEIVGVTSLVKDASVADNTGAIQTTVSENPNAIGYLSFSDVDTEKVNVVSYEDTEISPDTLKDDSYKLKRNFYFITRIGEKLSASGQAFIDFVLGKEGQKIVSEKGLLSID